MGLWMGTRFPSFGTYSGYPLGQRSGGLGEEILRLPQLRKRGEGVLGEGFFPPPGVVPVRNSVCQLPHAPIGGGVRKTHELGEGAEPPPAVRFGNRFPPNPLLNSSSRIPYGILSIFEEN